MRLPIHRALFLALTAVVVVLVIVVVYLSGSGLRNDLMGLYREELSRELGLAELLVEGLDVPGVDSVAREIQGRIGYRVTVIGVDGTVLGDSDVSRRRLGSVGDHSDRPEVRGALEDGTAFSERLSATVNRRLLYGARVVELDGEPVILRISASLEDIEATVRQMRWSVAGAGFVALLLALVASYGLARILARPLSEIADRARDMAEGEFDVRAPRVGGIAELEDLAGAFNRLAEELRVHLSELSRERDSMQALIDSMAEGVIALTEDARVLRLNRAASEMLDLPRPLQFAPIGTLVRHPELRELMEASVAKPFQAREVALGDRHLIFSARLLDQGGAVVTFLEVTEIRRLEQVRSDFVANASHELKTPLTTMRGFAETLLDDDPPDNLRREFLTSIRNNTVRLQHLVDDLLDLSRLESGGWTAKKENVDVPAVARRAWASFQERAEAQDIAFHVAGEGRAVADEQGLDQIFSNLYDNALRYSGQEGRLEVKVDTGGDLVRISVEDTGSGIPSASLPRIFERFYRVDDHRDRDLGGTGLGLAIVRHLVQAMGGEVEAESQLGNGTTIRFTLPPVRAGSGEGESE